MLRNREIKIKKNTDRDSERDDNRNRRKVKREKYIGPHGISWLGLCLLHTCVHEHIVHALHILVHVSLYEHMPVYVHTLCIVSFDRAFHPWLGGSCNWSLMGLTHWVLNE